MARSSTTWQPGQSGNPRGRLPVAEELSTILEIASNRVMNVGEKRQRRKNVLANMIWVAVTTGYLIYPPDPETGEVVLFELSWDVWFKLVRFLYQHIDGPPRFQIDVTSQEQRLSLNGGKSEVKVGGSMVFADGNGRFWTQKRGN